MNLSITAVADGIANATQTLVDALNTANALQTAVANAKEILAVRKSEILVANASDPKALGSNEATREATIASMLSTEVDAVKQAEFALLCHASKVEIARLRLQEAQANLRLLEIQAGALVNQVYA